MDDDDDNYYEVSDDFVIKNTGKRIYDAPVFMQKVPTEKENKNFIQIGIQAYIPRKGEEEKESKPIFARRTPELDAGYNRMIENLARALVPDMMQKMEVYKQSAEYLEKYIVEQEKMRDDKKALLKKKHQREIEENDKDFNRKIDYAKKILEKRKTTESDI